MANQLRAFEGRLIATLGDPSFFSQLSFSYIGISDHRVIDLVSDRQIPVCRLKHGLPESFFEPIKDLKQPISLIEQGCSTPGMIMAIKLERLPIRLAVNIEKAMEDDRNAYRSLCNWNPPTDRDIGVPKASILYLVNLGDIWFTQAIPGHIPSLSKSVLVLRKAIESRRSFNRLKNNHKL
jgi:hypothetical protein